MSRARTGGTRGPIQFPKLNRFIRLRCVLPHSQILRPATMGIHRDESVIIVGERISGGGGGAKVAERIGKLGRRVNGGKF